MVFVRPLFPLLNCRVSTVCLNRAGNFSRTALASDVGVRTQASNIVVGLFTTIVLCQLTDILYYIPKVRAITTIHI
jgi:MFS superfamily sulfate permease-like transporter